MVLEMAAKRHRNTQMKQIHAIESKQSLDVNKRPKLQDLYCWLCHRNDTNVNCSTCIRSYHHGCIGQRTTKSLQYQCATCNRLNLANSCTAAKFTNVEYLNQLLVLTTMRLLDDQEFNGFNRNYYENHPKKVEDCGIVNPIHMDSIDVKVQNSKYGSTFDFMNDIKWICHNVNIMDNDPENKNNLRIAKRLEKFCTKEIYDIEMCHQCYYRSNTQTNWFTAVCDPPHLLVWARINDHSDYAPAKVLGLNGGGGGGGGGGSAATSKKVDVRFFTDHEMAVIPTSNCYLFSKRKPLKKSDQHIQFKQKTVSREVGIYVANIRNMFSDFVEAEHRTKFNEQKIVTHLTSMFPGLRISRDYQLITKPSYLNRLVRRHAPVALPSNDDTDSSSNVDNDSGPHEKSVSAVKTTSSLNPTLILEKCDSLLTQKRPNFNFESSKNDETVEISCSTNHEPCIDECACAQTVRTDGGETSVSSSTIANTREQSSTNAEERASNGQNSTVLLTVAVTSVPSNEIYTANNGNGQLVAIARKETGLSQNMQPIDSQTNAPQHRSNLRVNRITNLAEINDSVNLPLSTASKSTEPIPLNCDWEEMLDKLQQTIRKRHRINRKIVLKRERAHLMNVNQLKSLVNVLRKKNHKLQMSARKSEQQHSKQLQTMQQNAIDETKRKKWCWNCQIELKHVVFNMPMCKDCFNRNWFGHGENVAESTPQDAVALNVNTNGFQNHVFVEPLIVQQQSNAVDQLLPAFDDDDPFSLELEGF